MKFRLITLALVVGLLGLFAVAPMSAAAMLSRNDESTNTITSSTNGPFHAAGSNRGNTFGT